MFLPISSNNGKTFSNVFAGPPTMIDRVALRAPTSPPETGASRYSQPSALIFCANTFVAIGEMELMSTTTWPWLRPAATPFSANNTASTSGVSGTIVMTMSARSATPRALRHWVALLRAIASGVLPRVWTKS